MSAHAAIAIGSLPLFSRTHLNAFPAPHSYLKPDEAARTEWQGWLHAHGEPPFIGLCWRSGKLTGMRHRQFASLMHWADFAHRAHGTLISLQYDASDSEIDELRVRSGRDILVPSLLDQKQEIDRTASLIAALDCVVSAPTAVSWMAAAQGVKTLKILYNRTWTSFGTDYEPFAPSCIVMAPERAGDWAACLDKALKSLPRDV